MEVVHFLKKFILSYLLQNNRGNRVKQFSRWFRRNKSKKLTTFEQIFYNNECTESQAIKGNPNIFKMCRQYNTDITGVLFSLLTFPFVTQTSPVGMCLFNKFNLRICEFWVVSMEMEIMNFNSLWVCRLWLCDLTR